MYVIQDEVTRKFWNPYKKHADTFPDIYADVSDYPDWYEIQHATMYRFMSDVKRVVGVLQRKGFKVQVYKIKLEKV